MFIIYTYNVNSLIFFSLTIFFYIFQNEIRITVRVWLKLFKTEITLMRTIPWMTDTSTSCSKKGIKTSKPLKDLAWTWRTIISISEMFYLNLMWTLYLLSLSLNYMRTLCILTLLPKLFHLNQSTLIVSISGKNF